MCPFGSHNQDTAGESGLTQFLMNEVTRLQKALQDERKTRLEVSARLTEHTDTIRQLQTRECELRKQHERVQRMREERDQMWDKARHLKDENYKLMSDMNRLSEEKNCALMCNRDLQLEVGLFKIIWPSRWTFHAFMCIKVLIK